MSEHPSLTKCILSILLLGYQGCGILDDSSDEDGEQMRLLFEREGEIWLYDMIGGDYEKLIAQGKIVYTNELGYSYPREWASSPRWSPDGSQIVFNEAIFTDASNLKILDLETREQRFFPNYIFRQDGSAEWILSGTKLLFSKSIASLGRNYEIFIMDVNGDNETQLTDRPSSSDTNPTLSYTSQTIVFMSDDSIGRTQLFKMNLDGSGVSQLTFSSELFPNPHMYPQFSPVSDELLYVTKKDAESYRDIWKVENMDFSNPVQLTDTPQLMELYPSWSNDGKYIIFTRFAGTSGYFTDPEIWMMNSDGSEQKLIIENAEIPDLWVIERLGIPL